MLKRPSGKVHDNYQRAADARLHAKQADDEDTRDFGLDQEQRRIDIASGLQFQERYNAILRL